MKGFSERNLKRMLAFYHAYPAIRSKVPQAVALLPDPTPVQQRYAARMDEDLLWRIPWGHHALLIEKVKDVSTRLWYMRQTLEQGWSRNILALMIDTGCTSARVQQPTTFLPACLPPVGPGAANAQRPLSVRLSHPGRAFSRTRTRNQLDPSPGKLPARIGSGFAFVGRQYLVSVGEDDFYIDLLFYHLRLRCFVVIDLKRGKFKPEYAGKINFYCNVIDDHLKHASDQPTIGLILCQDKMRWWPNMRCGA